MPVSVRCPHCRMPCLVAEQHRGVPVKCGRCGGTFTTRADPKATKACLAPLPRVRLGIGAAGSSRTSGQANEDTFLVHHLVYCNLEDRHELAVVAASDDSHVISAVATALAPLLDEILNGEGNNNKIVAAACKDLASTLAVAVIRDGDVSLTRSGDASIYHHSAGRLNRLTSERFQLAAGDWLILAGRPHPFPDDALQAEIAAARSGALELSQRLVERAGGNACPFVVVGGI